MEKTKNEKRDRSSDEEWAKRLGWPYKMGGILKREIANVLAQPKYQGMTLAAFLKNPDKKEELWPMKSPNNYFVMVDYHFVPPFIMAWMQKYHGVAFRTWFPEEHVSFDQGKYTPVQYEQKQSYQLISEPGGKYRVLGSEEQANQDLYKKIDELTHAVNSQKEDYMEVILRLTKEKLGD